MDGININAIVLSVMPVGEADRRLLLLSKELGKISAFARGARRPTSTLIGAARPFSFGVFTLSAGRSSYTVQKAEISEYFEDLSRDVEKSAYGFAFSELSAYFARENEDGTEALSLLYYALKSLQRGQIPMKLVQIAFECRLIALNGLMPSFAACARCRKPLTEGAFSSALMQPLCRDCAPPDAKLPLQKSAVYALEYIRTSPLNRLFGFNVTEEVLREIAATDELLVHQAVDRELPARAMLSVLAAD